LLKTSALVLISYAGHIMRYVTGLVGRRRRENEIRERKK
jgi:hypothetical protein